MIGDKIKKYRKEKGLSQEGLARNADVTTTALIKIERRAVLNPRIDTVVKIAKALERSIEDLLSQ